MTHRMMLGLSLVLFNSTHLHSNDIAVPPAKAPQEPLTLDGHEIYEGRRILRDEDSYPRQSGRIIEGPILKEMDRHTRIVFALDKFDDVLVRVVDAKGKTIKNLACGVLGINAPAPFQKDSLHQEITWEGAEESLQAGHEVQVRVGCVPRFDCFIAHDPDQLVKNVCGMEVDSDGRLYVSFFTERRGDTEIRRFDRQGKLLGTVYPPSPQSLRTTLSALLNESDTQIVAICDVDRLHYRDRPWGDGTTYGREPASR